jgi:prepilin-type processing-associated H-X9-DG protein
VAVIASILTPPGRYSSGARHNARRASCQSHLKQIGLAVMQYSQDADEVLPRINFNAVATSTAPYAKPYGWVDALYPYTKSTLIFQCPSEADTDGAMDATQANFTDYWMNTNLSSLQLYKLESSTSTVLLGDGNDGSDGADARYNRNVLPKIWIDTESSPARRHLEGANYAFADGHVKWVKPELDKAKISNPGDYSFSIK